MGKADTVHDIPQVLVLLISPLSLSLVVYFFGYRLCETLYRTLLPRSIKTWAQSGSLKCSAQERLSRSGAEF